MRFLVHTFPMTLPMRFFVTRVFLSLWCWMQDLIWWHAQVYEVGTQAMHIACVFPKLSEMEQLLEGEHGSMKTL